MPSEVPSQNGTRAASAAARKYGLSLRDDPTGFWDAEHRNGRKVQVKRALYERAGGEPGVFRVWKGKLRELAQVRGSVVVVVENPENDHRPILKVEKVSPHDLLDRDDWHRSEQSSMFGKYEARIPWPELVSL